LLFILNTLVCGLKLMLNPCKNDMVHVMPGSACLLSLSLSLSLSTYIYIYIYISVRWACACVCDTYLYGLAFLARGNKLKMDISKTYFQIFCKNNQSISFKVFCSESQQCEGGEGIIPFIFVFFR
jgi:hypothetical protein